MTFRTVFDVAYQGYAAWSFPAFGLIFVGVGALLVFRPALMQELLPSGPQGKARVIFSRFLFVFALLWTAGSFVVTYLEYQIAASDLNSERCSVVEGPVTNFIPMPYIGHGEESFTVRNRCFSYSDYMVTAGFHNTDSRGGLIREDLYVRVTSFGNLILRLEVAQ